jgi:hypothetical protein
VKRLLVCIFLMPLCIAVLEAKIDVDIFGYYEPQFMGVYINSDLIQLLSNKLRVDFKSRFSQNITFAANFNALIYHGKTEWNILDFLPKSVNEAVTEGMRMFYVLPFQDRYYLDNAYVKFAFKRFDLIVGKQQISLGTGYVWNPTDVFNFKDYLDPTYEQPGHEAVRVDIPLGSSYTLTALYAPEDIWNNSAKLLQMKGRLWRFDVALTAIEKQWIYHDYTRFDMDVLNFSEFPEKRKLLGFSTAGELFGVGVWLEYAYNWMEESDDFYELVAGADYTFDFQTYIMLEFYHNTLGRTDYREYTLNDWMRLMAQEQKSIARDQIYMMVQHPVTDLIQLGISGIYCISDGSLALVPVVNVSISDNVELMAYLNYNTGDEGKTYSGSMGNGGMIRVRIYF